MVEISQNFVDFSEYMNFNLFCTLDGLKILCHQIIKKLPKIAKALQLKIAQKIHAKTLYNFLLTFFIVESLPSFSIS